MLLIGSLVIRTCSFTGPVTAEWLCVVPNTGCSNLLHVTLIACSCGLDVMRHVRGSQRHVVRKHLEGRRLTASNKSIAVEDLGNVKRAVAGSDYGNTCIVCMDCILNCMDGFL